MATMVGNANMIVLGYIVGVSFLLGVGALAWVALGPEP